MNRGSVDEKTGAVPLRAGDPAGPRVVIDFDAIEGRLSIGDQDAALAGPHGDIRDLDASARGQNPTLRLVARRAAHDRDPGARPLEIDVVQGDATGIGSRRERHRVAWAG